MSLRTPKAPKDYSQDDQEHLRRILRANDVNVLKSGQDVALINGEKLLVNAKDGLTAHAGGGQASATAMVYGINHFGTVAGAGDSGLLPPAVAGAKVDVCNRGANAMAVFPNGTDQVNDAGASISYSLASNTTVTFRCPTNGKWYV